jgi:hypothetical protein
MKSKKVLKLLTLPFIGERYVPEMRGTIMIDHGHCHVYACQLVKDKVVPDVACG